MSGEIKEDYTLFNEEKVIVCFINPWAGKKSDVKKLRDKLKEAFPNYTPLLINKTFVQDIEIYNVDETIEFLESLIEQLENRFTEYKG